MHANIKGKNILLCGSGSGGHFYPSLKIAKSLDKLGGNIFYIVAENKLDGEKIEHTSFKYIKLVSVGLKKNIFSFIKRQIINISKCYKYIKDNKIDLAIGFGGALSFSMCIASFLAKVKFIVHEQNTVIGRANKILSKFTTIYASSPLNIKENKYKIVGNPLVGQKKTQNVPYYDVVIVMGSLGSSSIDAKLKKYFDSYKTKYRILVVSKNFKTSNKYIDVVSYIENLNDYFANTRLVITRGGASTLAEISSNSCKVIIIPSPNVVGKHQHHNANYFKSIYGAMVVEEKDLDEVKLDKLVNDNLNCFVYVNERKKIETFDFLSLFLKEIDYELSNDKKSIKKA